MPTDRLGLLIIRAWIEEGSAEPLRAKVRIVTDVSADEGATRTFARSEDVLATVREWLAGIPTDCHLPGLSPPPA
ncbi:MAG: hypothetical protein QOJ69_1112 [Actinomycetota bacterium]|nr:hypothetical protein [Actinomycetota bacterium]MEA2843441.1 hypothetical protein [Actinomycetota bacterium]